MQGAGLWQPKCSAETCLWHVPHFTAQELVPVQPSLHASPERGFLCRPPNSSVPHQMLPQCHLSPALSGPHLLNALKGPIQMNIQTFGVTLESSWPWFPAPLVSSNKNASYNFPKRRNEIETVEFLGRLTEVWLGQSETQFTFISINFWTYRAFRILSVKWSWKCFYFECLSHLLETSSSSRHDQTNSTVLNQPFPSAPC